MLIFKSMLLQVNLIKELKKWAVGRVSLHIDRFYPCLLLIKSLKARSHMTFFGAPKDERRKPKDEFFFFFAKPIHTTFFSAYFS